MEILTDNDSDKDHPAPADPMSDLDDGNATDMGSFAEDDEDDEGPKKVRKTQRGDTREVIQMHRKVALMGVEKEGAC